MFDSFYNVFIWFAIFGTIAWALFRWGPVVGLGIIPAAAAGGELIKIILRMIGEIIFRRPLLACSLSIIGFLIWWIFFDQEPPPEPLDEVQAVLDAGRPKKSE